MELHPGKHSLIAIKVNWAGACMHAARDRDVKKILQIFILSGEPSVDYDLYRQASYFYVYLPWLNACLA